MAPKLSKHAISPSIGIILLVSIAVSVALITYVYVTGNLPYTSTSGVDVIEIYNVRWTAPNRVVLTLSNHGSSNKVLSVAYIDALQGYPASTVELEPRELRDVEFTFTDDVPPGEHTIKVVCKDGTMGVISHKFTRPITAATTTTTTVSITTTTSTTTTATPCFILETYYGTSLFEKIRGIQSFRDNFMAHTRIGRIWINIFNSAYYPISQAITPIIREHRELRGILRILLEPLIAAAIAAINLSLILPFDLEGRVFMAITLASTLVGTYMVPAACLMVRARHRRSELIKERHKGDMQETTGVK